jgi:hypothetical protein
VQTSLHFTSPKHRVLSEVLFQRIVSVSQDTRYMDHYALKSVVCTLFMPYLLCGNDQNSILSCVGVGVLCTVGARRVAAHSMRGCDISELCNSRAVCCVTRKSAISIMLVHQLDLNSIVIHPNIAVTARYCCSYRRQWGFHVEGV